MNEMEAQSWLQQRLRVSRETVSALDEFVGLLLGEADRQNLIAASTIPEIWSRHIVDSAQLLLHAPAGGRWIDIGSGAGLPGMVVALLRRDADMVMVEPRRRRAEFLLAAASRLNLSTVRVAALRAEQLGPEPFDTISARAVAPLDRLLTLGLRFARENTRWLLPKGRGAQAELEAARRTWQGDFRIEPSVTDPESAIIVAENVRPRRQR